MRFKTFMMNINVLNIILLTTIVLFALYVLIPLFHIKVKYTLPSAKKPEVGKEEKIVPTPTSSMAEYTIIADENPFHPERKIPTDIASEEPGIKPEFVLYGTLITDGVKIAYLEDLKSPHTTVGRGKRQMALQMGNTLSGYTISEVYHDRVVMVKGDDRIEVKVLDSRSKQKMGKETASPGKSLPRRPSSSKVPKPYGSRLSPVDPHRGLPPQ